MATPCSGATTYDCKGVADCYDTYISLVVFKTFVQRRIPTIVTTIDATFSSFPDLSAVLTFLPLI